MSNASLDRWKRRLAKVPVEVRKAASARALSEADALASAIKGRAPRDDGALQESIRTESGGTGDRWYVKAGGDKTTRPVREGASATYDYALGQEFGNEHVPAQPFFWPTYRMLRRGIRGRIARAAQAAARKTFEGGA